MASSQAVIGAQCPTQSRQTVAGSSSLLPRGSNKRIPSFAGFKQSLAAPEVGLQFTRVMASPALSCTQPS